MYFFFLCGQKEKYQKKEAADQNRQALLRLPMTARQIRFAQTPLFPVIGNLRIRSLTGRHVRNGRYHIFYPYIITHGQEILISCKVTIYLLNYSMR